MLSSLWSNPECALEIILMKWKSDGSYLAAALDYLQENKANFRMKYLNLARRSILRLIDITVASDEKYPLAKICLEIDFEQVHHKDHGFRGFSPEWMRPWREACASQTWKDGKERLKKLYLYPVKSFFVRTSLHVLAEKLLQKNMQKLEQWRDRVGFLSTSEAAQAKECLQESMDILGSFKENEVVLDPIWYKRFFQFHEPDGTNLFAYKNLQMDQLREYRQKFTQLKILHDSASSTGGLVPNLLNAATVLKESKVILDTVQCDDMPLTNEELSPHPSTPTMVGSSHRPCNELRMLLKDVYENWIIGHDIRKTVHCLLRHLKSFSISNALKPEENVFILISQTIPPNNQVSFTLGVLKAITDSWCQLPTRCSDDYFETWIAVRDSSTLESLTETLAKEFDIPYEIKLSLDDRMQPVVVKLILDVFAGLVGEYLVRDLKAYIKECHASGQPYTWALHDYKSILDNLHRRKIKIDQDLFAFLGRLLVWKGIDENGDVDEEERMFFETSDDEPNDSESESIESDYSDTEIED